MSFLQISKKNLLISIFFPFSCFLISPSHAEENSEQMGWKIIFPMRDKILMRKREVPGSSLLEMNSRAVIKAPMSAVFSVIDDNSHRTDWMVHTIKAEVQKKMGDDFIFHTIIQGKGPIWDREAFLFTSVACKPIPKSLKQTKRIEVTFTTDHPQVKSIPTTKGKYIRIETMKGHWYIWPGENPNEANVEYQIYVDVGGGVGDFIKGIVVEAVAHDTVFNLRKQVVKYPVANLQQISEDAPQVFRDGCLTK